MNSEAQLTVSCCAVTGVLSKRSSRVSGRGGRAWKAWIMDQRGAAASAAGVSEAEHFSGRGWPLSWRSWAALKVLRRQIAWCEQNCREIREANLYRWP